MNVHALSLSLALGLMAVVRVSAAEMPRLIEAETGQVSGGAVVITDTNANAGSAVRLVPHGRTVWTVSAATAGRYELNVRYRSAGAALWPLLETNGTRRGLGLSATFGEWSEAHVIVPLVEGTNALALEATETEVVIDHLRFTALPREHPAPVYELPVVSPREARVDLRHPRDLVFLLRRNGRGTPTARLAGAPVAVTTQLFEPVDDAVRLTVPADAVASLPVGENILHLRFPDGAEIAVPLRTSRGSLAAPLLIAVLDMDHGNSSVIRLPDGQVAVIDCGKPEYGASRLVPFLAAHGITRVDHLFITHNHDDHIGGRDALRAAVQIGAEHDNTAYHTGDLFELGGVSWFVLNAADYGKDENSRSLSLQLTYRGFVYTDGADTYGHNQVRLLERFPERTRSHVVFGNHHFHGSVDVNYLRRTDAALFIVSANPAVYERAAFTEDFKRGVEAYLKANNGRCREALLTPEVGNILIRVQDAQQWSYETAPVGVVFSDFASPGS